MQFLDYLHINLMSISSISILLITLVLGAKILRDKRKRSIDISMKVISTLFLRFVVQYSIFVLQILRIKSNLKNYSAKLAKKDKTL